ncbi:peptidase, partial [Streptomyces sp. SID10244]|nr:peptidase [Streptomyces sp. SID10244]
MTTSIPIGLTPFHFDGALNGILISGRWPESTLEWTQTLVASVRIACRPGFLPTTT